MNAHNCKRAWSCLATGALIAGCGNPEPLPSELDASYWVQPSSFAPDDDTFRFTAIYGHQDHDALPDADSFRVSVNGTTLALRKGTCGGEVRHCLFDGQGPRVAAGEPVTFTLDFPWTTTAQSTVEMVAPAEILAPTSGAELSAREVTTVTWSNTPSATIDSVVLRIPADAGDFDSWPGVTALPGEASTFITPDDYARYLDGLSRFHGVSPPFEAELLLLRSRTAPTSPPFQAGEIRLEDVVARVPVVIVP